MSIPAIVLMWHTGDSKVVAKSGVPSVTLRTQQIEVITYSRCILYSTCIMMDLASTVTGFEQYSPFDGFALRGIIK